MNTELIDVSCSQCGSNKRNYKYKLNNSSIVQCDSCRFLYVNPRISSEDIKKKLQEWAKSDVIDDERLRISFDKNTKIIYQQYLNRISQYINKDIGTILDVGCSTGAFLSVAKNNGWQVKGIEIGRESAKYANSIGIDVETGSIKNIEIEKEKYDAVAFLEVIEHLEDPKDALKRIYDYLKPGGALIVSTPNFDSLYRRIHKQKWWVINCEEEHIMFFNALSLQNALEETGFTVVDKVIRGIDIAGIVKSFKRSNAPTDSGQTYYSSRYTKEKIKIIFSKIGLISFIRLCLRGFDKLSSSKHSPFYAMGEQLVFIAIKDGEKCRKE